MDELDQMNTKPLTDKQKRFCEEYILDLNATQAALRAGYCANTVNQTGPANLVKVGIKKEIDRLKAIKSKEIGLTAEFIINNLRSIAVNNAESSPAVSVRAFELLGKVKGIFEPDNRQKAPQTAQITFIDGTRTAEEVELALIQRRKQLGNAICEG
ncbi:MAG: terminase small subunit [Thermodesulfovibrionales bacterium]|nr:terminase small subunit [Thermodesulfovibrionales bacterium]